MNINDGGGGGGGATFVFLVSIFCVRFSQVNVKSVQFQRNSSKHALPIAIAAGGGGLGLGKFFDTGIQHGQAINFSIPYRKRIMYGEK